MYYFIGEIMIYFISIEMWVYDDVWFVVNVYIIL